SSRATRATPRPRRAVHCTWTVHSWSRTWRSRAHSGAWATCPVRAVPCGTRRRCSGTGRPTTSCPPPLGRPSVACERTSRRRSGCSRVRHEQDASVSYASARKPSPHGPYDLMLGNGSLSAAEAVTSAMSSSWRSLMPEDERECALLEMRAAQLARRQQQEDPGETIEVAVFRFGRERYAIELACLLQIFALRDLALLPGARPPVIGLAPWRG